MAGPLMAEVLIKFDVEPSEQAKEYVKAVVLETMRDMLMDSSWLQELIEKRVKEVVTGGSRS